MDKIIDVHQTRGVMKSDPRAARGRLALWVFSASSVVISVATLLLGNTTPTAILGIVLAVTFGLLQGARPSDTGSSGSEIDVEMVLRTRIRERLDKELYDLEGADLIALTLDGPGPRLRGVSMNDLGLLLGSVGTNRITITGPPGSGKTVAMLAVARRLVEPGSQSVIPILLRAEEWKGQPIRDWLIEVTCNVYKIDAALVAGMFAHGRLTALVDGLDEMHSHEEVVDGPRRYPRASHLLSELQSASAGTQPLVFVLSCQTMTYRHLERDGSVGARTLEFTLRPVGSDRVHAELAVSAAGREWLGLLNELHGASRAALLRTLSMPFYLRMAASGGARVTADVRLQTLGEDNLQSQILHSFVVKRLSMIEGASCGASATRTLRSIAEWLKDNEQTERTFRGRPLPTVDIVPHRLWPMAGDRLARAVSVAFAFCILAPVVPIVLWALDRAELGPKVNVAAWSSVALVFALAAYDSYQPWPHPKRLVWSRILTRLGLARLAGSAALGAVLAGLTLTPSQPQFSGGLLVGVVVTFGLGTALGVRDSAPTVPLVGAGGVVGLPFALVAAPLTRGVGYSGGVTIGAAIGTLSLLIGVKLLLRATGAPSGYRLDPRPYPFARNDLLTGLVSAVVLVVALVPALVILPGHRFALAQSLGVVGSIGFLSGLGLVSSTWRRQVATSLSIPNRLSLNVAAVLDRSVAVGLMRRAGVSYQFRHRRVRDELAN